MLKQTVLPFKIEKTQEEMTSHAGLSIFGEFFRGLGLRELANTYLPHPQGPRGYKPWEVLEPMILMLVGGGRAIDDLRVIRSDTGLLELLDIETVPSSDAVRDWLKNGYHRDGISGMEEISRKLLKIRLKKDYPTMRTFLPKKHEAISSEAHFLFSNLDL